MRCGLTRSKQIEAGKCMSCHERSGDTLIPRLAFCFVDHRGLISCRQGGGFVTPIVTLESRL